jgi:hypothetical protein
VGAWRLADLWAVLAGRLVDALVPEGEVDTLLHKAGRRVNGAGTFRDAVRSTAARVVYAWWLNVVVLGLHVTPPWGGTPLALPLNVRLHRKGGRTLMDLADDMIRELDGWCPERHFALCADGAYATLAGRAPPPHAGDLPPAARCRAVRVTSARAPGRRGRPAKRGRRLPTPETLAGRHKTGWVRSTVDLRGRRAHRVLWSRPVLWYGVCPDQLVLLVVVRDPDGKERDDSFFTTDLTAAPRAVTSQYAGRSAIEDTFRNTKQFLGAEDPCAGSIMAPSVPPRSRSGSPRRSGSAKLTTCGGSHRPRSSHVAGLRITSCTQDGGRSGLASNGPTCIDFCI